MDCMQIGRLIYSLRKEQGLTQKQLADQLHVSDKAVSKWERGLGCPDVSLLTGLSDVLRTDISDILSGVLSSNDKDGGNMKQIKFYACLECGNLLTATGEGEISCCGRKLSPLSLQPENEGHIPSIEEIEDDYYVTFEHKMERSHYISFVACVLYDRVQFIKLYPEQGAEVRFPKVHRATLYYYCTRDGLFQRQL